MIYPDLSTPTLEELREKQLHLMKLVQQTSYSNRAQLQYFLKAYTYEINRRVEEEKAAREQTRQNSST